MDKIKPTYLFYDIETTGLNKYFDQVLQFAAIRTDLTLNELERHFIQIRLNCDVIPSPAAVLTHRLGLHTMQHGESEIVAIKKIHRLMNTPGTISCGYNNLGFDDEFLRFSFYRNLLPPYTHQYANQCRRLDIYPITILFYLFKREVITWFTHANKISLRLEHLNAVNQLAQGRAHNAMVDVEVTLALAKKFSTQRTMWDYVNGYFDKNEDLRRSARLPIGLALPTMTLQEGLMINGSFGHKAHYQAPVLSLGQHQHYKNQSLWLHLDSTTLTHTTVDNIADTTLISRKRAGEQPLLLPPQPRFLTHLSTQRQQLANANKIWLQQHPNILPLICDYYQQYKYPTVENIDADAALYDLDFPSPHEEFLFQQFHLAKLVDKTNMAAQFPNAVRREQAIRILGRHYPHILSQQLQQQFAAYQQKSRTDYRGQLNLTVVEALEQIDTLTVNNVLDTEQLDLLDELRGYLRTHPALKSEQQQ